MYSLFPAAARSQMIGLVAAVITIALLLIGCATAKPKPAYPRVEATDATTHSILKLENTMPTSMFALRVRAPIALTIEVDGFYPIDAKKLVKGQYLPTGTTEVRLPPGSHTLVHTGKLLQNSPYYFNAVTLNFDTEAGKTYLIKFGESGTIMKPAYTVQYHGWSKEETAQWPNENRIANPLGH